MSSEPKGKAPKGGAGQSHERSQSGEAAGSDITISPSFMNSVAEFSDRLRGGHAGGGVAGTLPSRSEPSESSSSSSGWGLLSKFVTSEHLKGFVDGPAQTKPPVQPPPSTGQSGGWSAPPSRGGAVTGNLSGCLV